MQIEIEIERPWSLCAVLTGIVAFILWTNATVSAPNAAATADIAAEGGNSSSQSQELVEAERSVRLAREEQSLLLHQEVLLRHQLEVIQQTLEQSAYNNNVPGTDDLHRMSNKLVTLLQDKRQAEAHLRVAIHELWDAQERAGKISTNTRGPVQQLQWPIQPERGISAGYLDEGYEEIFGIPHRAIDIPTDQGTPIRAPADGVVEQVVDNGYGYSYLIVKHEGLVTIYGHIDTFVVAEGDRVRTGEVLALSGGRPGSRGAGSLSTGPHLHFEVMQNGKHINPLTVLPSLQ